MYTISEFNQETILSSLYEYVGKYDVQKNYCGIAMGARKVLSVLLPCIKEEKGKKIMDVPKMLVAIKSLKNVAEMIPESERKIYPTMSNKMSEYQYIMDKYKEYSKYIKGEDGRSIDQPKLTYEVLAKEQFKKYWSWHNNAKENWQEADEEYKDMYQAKGEAYHLVASELQGITTKKDFEKVLERLEQKSEEYKCDDYKKMEGDFLRLSVKDLKVAAKKCIEVGNN